MSAASSTLDQKHPVQPSDSVQGKHVEVDFGGMAWLGIVDDVRICSETGQLEYLIRWPSDGHHAPTWVLQDTVSFMDLSAGRKTRGARHNYAEKSFKASAPVAANGTFQAERQSATAPSSGHPELKDAMRQFSEVPQFPSRPLPLHAYDCSLGVRGSRHSVGHKSRRAIQPKLTPPARFSKSSPDKKSSQSRMAFLLESSLR